jgi:hypothetical protein
VVWKEVPDLDTYRKVEVTRVEIGGSVMLLGKHVSGWGSPVYMHALAEDWHLWVSGDGSAIVATIGDVVKSRDDIVAICMPTRPPDLSKAEKKILAAL